MPAPPPRDQANKIIPHNHSEILPEHHVIRHVNPLDLHPTEKRVSSGAYSGSSDDGVMSVDIEEWMLADGLDRLHYVREEEGARRISVSALRALGFMVGWDPDGGHQHHGAVWGVIGPKKRKKIHRLAPECLKKAAGET